MACFAWLVRLCFDALNHIKVVSVLRKDFCELKLAADLTGEKSSTSKPLDT